MPLVFLSEIPYGPPALALTDWRAGASLSQAFAPEAPIPTVLSYPLLAVAAFGLPFLLAAERVERLRAGLDASGSGTPASEPAAWRVWLTRTTGALLVGVGLAGGLGLV